MRPQLAQRRAAGFAGASVSPSPRIEDLVRNQLQDGYQQCVARLLGDQLNPYAGRRLYVEFQNVGNPGVDFVTPPTGFSTSEGVEYYNSLDTGDGFDYLRIEVASATLKLLSGYPGSVANAIEYLGYATASDAMLGLPFGADYNSLVYGVAIAAAPEPNNPSADIIIGRAYYTADKQKLCPTAGVMAVSYLLVPVAA